MTTSIETCDTCGKTLQVNNTSARPGGGVVGCPDDSDTCGLSESGINKTVEGEVDE